MLRHWNLPPGAFIQHKYVLSTRMYTNLVRMLYKLWFFDFQACDFAVRYATHTTFHLHREAFDFRIQEGIVCVYADKYISNDIYFHFSTPRQHSSQWSSSALGSLSTSAIRITTIHVGKILRPCFSPLITARITLQWEWWPWNSLEPFQGNFSRLLKTFVSCNKWVSKQQSHQIFSSLQPIRSTYAWVPSFISPPLFDIWVLHVAFIWSIISTKSHTFELTSLSLALFMLPFIFNESYHTKFFATKVESKRVMKSSPCLYVLTIQIGFHSIWQLTQGGDCDLHTALVESNQPLDSD